MLSIAFSPDGTLLASGSRSHSRASSENKPLQIWELLTGDLRHAFGGDSDSVESVAFSPDNQFLAAIWPERRALQILDLKTGNLLQTLEEHSSDSIAFSPDGRLLGSSGLETTKLWNLETGKLQQTLKRSSLSIAFSPDSRLLASGSSDSNEASGI
ncbi:unnamed protein product [Penicillium salamii]|nr:unnamed protein product [Penicillium salamii]